MRFFKFSIFLSLLLSLNISFSQETKTALCSPGITPLSEDLPVRAGGRVKPYLVLHQESQKFLTGKKKNSFLSFCEMSFLRDKPLSDIKTPILIEHVETKKLLGMKEDQTSLTPHELAQKKSLIQAQRMRIKEENSFKKDLTKTLNRIITFEQITKGNAINIYTEVNGKKDWHPIATILSKPDDEIKSIITNSKATYIADHGDGYLLELTYVKSSIFSISMLIALLGIFATVLAKKLSFGVGISILVVIIETIAMTMRVYISGRAPITNMYETVMFSGYGALVIALIILYFKRDKTYLLAGLGYNILCLFMMKFANNMLSSSISPLVPVLRDNFWLSTHVTTIILSYAALALSWLIANIALIKLRFGKLTTAEYNYSQQMIYTSIKIGIVLLAAGIILGGVWADYSWGRFWGWDPKETWSLIVLLFYMAVLHGKYTNWITTHRFVMLAAAGFMTVMMAWFGVNYILASGLHSYGFSEGGAVFLGTFFLVQIIIIALCASAKSTKNA